MGVAGSNHRGNRGTGRPRKPASAADKSGRSGPGKRAVRRVTVKKPLSFTIPSDFAAGRDVQKQILDDVTRHGYTSQNQFAVKLALEEALINAIKHGNRLNPSKKVRIEAKVSARRLEIIIEDEGPGFARGAVPDPTLRENLEKCSGRGILLMEAYMNSVHWSRGGRRVKMVKKNDADPA
jgi:serine/threonine-protein kinase RsbW